MGSGELKPRGQVYSATGAPTASPPPLGESGLIGVLEQLRGLPPEQLTREAQRRLIEWADRPIADDICLLALSPKAL